MLQNLNNFFSLITARQVKTAIEPDDLIVIGTRDTRFGGNYKPTVIKACNFGGGGGTSDAVEVFSCTRWC
jgi:hypothetical protein